MTTETAPLQAVQVDALVMRLRKYGTGSIDAIRLMREAADTIEELALEVYSCPPERDPANWPENMNT